MEKEIRNFEGEIRNAGAARKVEGYAAVFNAESRDLGDFTEIIEEHAFDNVIPESDVFARFNHGEKILARCNHGKGSLTLSIDERGLRYEFDAHDTDAGNELLYFLRNGDISQSSFAFTVAKDTWTKNADGKYLRTINKIGKLYDVSPVWSAAYGDATSVSCRSFEEFKAHEAEELRKAQEEEAKRQAEEEAAKEAERQENIKKNWEKLVEENKKYMVPNQ